MPPGLKASNRTYVRGTWVHPAGGSRLDGYSAAGTVKTTRVPLPG
jgi:hypothetical protein